MAEPAFNRKRLQELAAVHAEFSDFEFEDYPEDDDQASRTSDFEAQFAEAEDSLDAEFVDLGSDGAPIPGSGTMTEDPLDPVLKDYLDRVKDWMGDGVEGKTNFVNNADSIDEARNERLRLAGQIMLKPELISDPRLGQAAKYLHADMAYISRSDPSSGDYSDFMQRRAELRDQIFQGKPVVTSEDYAQVAGRVQHMIAGETHINLQYELIDLRKEAALEHFDDPRFIVEVYRNKKGLMDELLVDFDRKDLLASGLKTDTATRGRSAAMAETFNAEVKNHGREPKNGAEMVRNFQMTREVGLNIRHNQRAISGFADFHPQNGVHFERGMAALENVRWSDGMWDEYANKLSLSQRKFIIENKGPAAAFKVAREQFVRQFADGDPDMAKSFAVMEQAASKIERSPALQEKLTKIGEPDDVASFHMLTEKYREKALGKSVTDKVDASITKKMTDDGTLIGLEGGTQAVRMGSLSKEGEKGEEYDLKLSKDAAIDVVDGAHVRVANSAEDLAEGKGIVMRLDGIVAPPEGVATKSGKLDAGLEAKANLEGVIKRHGIASLGMKICRTDKGEETIELKTADGENVSQRMLRDGYAMPTKDSLEGNRREYMAKQAEANNRGLWKDGFPDMDQSWRREKNAPELTWRDKRLNLVNTVNGSLCHTQMDVARSLTRSETKLFALPLSKFAGSNLVDREISKVIDRNPSRIMDIYGGNMDVLNDLRKRKDKLSQSEKQAHDQLALGRRALGQALVERNLLDPKQFQKDSQELMSRKGIKISGEGIRKIADSAGKVVDAGVKTASHGSKKIKRGLDWLLDEAMS